jgi:uncharacterized membrane protein YvbJ
MDMINKMRKRMNKKGDVPTTILVIGIIVVYIFALVSFIISMTRTQGVLLEANILEEMNNKIDQYYFYSNLNQFSRDEILDMLGAKTDNSGKKYLYSEKTSGAKKIMYVEYYPQA